MASPGEARDRDRCRAGCGQQPIPGEAGTAHTAPMTDLSLTCQHVDVALSLQQTIRERETAQSGTPSAVTIGAACGQPSIGSVENDGVRHRFCTDHVLEERISR